MPPVSRPLRCRPVASLSIWLAGRVAAPRPRMLDSPRSGAPCSRRAFLRGCLEADQLPRWVSANNERFGVSVDCDGWKVWQPVGDSGLWVEVHVALSNRGPQLLGSGRNLSAVWAADVLGPVGHKVDDHGHTSTLRRPCPVPVLGDNTRCSDQRHSIPIPTRASPI